MEPTYLLPQDGELNQELDPDHPAGDEVHPRLGADSPISGSGVREPPLENRPKSRRDWKVTEPPMSDQGVRPDLMGNVQVIEVLLVGEVESTSPDDVHGWVWTRAGSNRRSGSAFSWHCR